MGEEISGFRYNANIAGRGKMKYSMLLMVDNSYMATSYH